MSNELRKQIEKKILDCNHILRQRAEHWQWELHEEEGKQKAYKEVLDLLADYEKTHIPIKKLQEARTSHVSVCHCDLCQLYREYFKK